MKLPTDMFRMCFCRLILLLLAVHLSIFEMHAKETPFQVQLKVAKELAYTDSQRGIDISETLYKQSTNKKEELAALMVSASIYYIIRDLNAAFDSARKAEAIAIAINDQDWQNRIIELYSLIYWNMDSTNESFGDLEPKNKFLLKLNDKDHIAVKKSISIQNKAYLHFLNLDYKRAIKELHRGEVLYPILEDIIIGPYHIAYTETLKARIYDAENKYERSLEAYQKAIGYLLGFDPSQTNPIYGYIYTGMAVLQMKRGLFNEAKEYLDKAEITVNANENIVLEIHYKSDLLSYYAETEDLGRYHLTKDDLTVLEQSMQEEINSTLLNLSETLDEKEKSYISEASLYKSVSIVLVFLLLSTLGFAYFKKRKNKNGGKTKKQIIYSVKQNKTLKVETKTEVPSKVNSKQEVKPGTEHISTETLKRIKDSLEEFEQSDIFLNPTVGALTIASYCQTNIRYVSDVINTHKGESISSYLNNLRISYILSKLETEEVYRSYKISYLADEAGFSNPSKFSTEFKRIVGMPPSTYITRKFK